MLKFITNGNFIELWNLEDSGVPNVNNPNYYKRLFNLHNTSKCIDWSLPSNTNLITFTIDETKFPEIPITTIYFDGVAMNSQDDFETGITAMFPGLAGGSPGGSSYLPEVLGSYESNAEAVAAIGVGKFYMSTTLINDSPIILITV
jgi:hypothetical protein